MTISPDSQVDIFLPYMRDVGKSKQALHELNLMWGMIESSAKLNCPVESKSILPAMAATREKFQQLEQELVRNLVQEKMRNVLDALDTKAQYVIDIVVRNLYERTADVGFLATDGDLCRFVAGLDSDGESIRRRLHAYREKYTVYEDILLLDPSGKVLLQLNQAMSVACSSDQLVAHTLSSDTFVEHFGPSDLQPGKREALIYARRMCHPQTGVVVGILCLCFAFEEEMDRIFAAHGDASERSNMLLLDADNRVIASADPLWIAIGARVPVNYAPQPRVMMFAGREYLVRTHASAGYQGYSGPQGWQGQVMIAVDIAFNDSHDPTLSHLDSELADGLLAHARLFCPPLFDIMSAAESAADTIRRVVWNGQLTTRGNDDGHLRLKTILAQISETGVRSSELFAQSIHDLFETVLASGMRDAQFVSHLLVDLLDRNLYERANDCRWWALSPELRMLLALPERSSADAARMTAVLEYINGLYTAYTGLLVYDREGNIICSTLAANVDVADARIEGNTLQQVLALRTQQDYCVTPFATSPLYNGAPTYVYHAAIRHPEMQNSVIGGIGIVFDAGPEFMAMLQGSLIGQKGTDAFFVDRSGTVIASTDATHAIGSTLDIGANLLALDNGNSDAQILVRDNQYAIVGCSASQGYREFKVSDGYSADIIAVVIKPVGAVAQRTVDDARKVHLLESAQSNSGNAEFATFFIDGKLFAMATASVSQAVPAVKVAPVSACRALQCIGVLHVDANEPGVDSGFVWVFDVGALLSGRASSIDAGSQVVIVRNNARSVGILVSALHGVASLNLAKIIPMPLAGAKGVGRALVKEVIEANAGELLIQVIDHDYLFEMLTEPGVKMFA